MVQIIQNQGGGGGGGGTPYTAGTGIEISAQNEISVDTDVVQTVGNMVDNLTGADDDHYPTAKAVADAISGGGLGDVIGPASSTDGDIVLFDGATGKIIKDSGVGLSSKLDASALSNNNYGGAWQGDSTHTPTKGVLYDKIHTMDVEIGNKAADTAVVKLTGNQTINGTKTFGTSPVVPSKTTDATNTGTAIATEAQVYNVAEDVATINGKIPSAATSSNQLADKNYVDDSINSVTAYYITKNAQGDQWTSYAELAAATTFYSGGVVRTPTKNDYTIVLDDENHDNATTRYIYNSGWEYQYTVNETALTQAQLDALNSGITSGKVSTYDGYASTISGKQDALTLPATPTSGHLVTWGANNKTLADGGAIPTIVYATQAEYTALLPGAESDGKHYFIYHTSGGGGWQPGVNTVMYYPFETDQLDHVGSSSIYTTGTTAAGVMGYNFSFSGNVSISNAPASCIFMAYWIRANSTLSTISGGPSLKGELRFNFSHSVAGWTNVFQCDMVDDSWQKSSTQSVSIGTWYHMAMGYDGTNINCYINGTKVWTYVGTPTSGGAIGIGNSVDENLSELIGESVCWSDADVLAYFNQTKSNYGY